MKSLSMQKRLASEILKAGKSRVRFVEDRLDEVKEAITREDIKSLINKGAITVVKKKGVSRSRVKKHHLQKKKGRRSGPGKRKGTKKARNPKKKVWINKIRPQRRLIKDLKKKGRLTTRRLRKLYNLSKGGFFRSKKHLRLYIKKKYGE